MEQVKSNTCPYCGRTFKPRGLGTHIREAHGLKIRTVVRNVVNNSSDYSTVVNDSSDYSTVVQRPSDYVKKKSQIVQVKSEPALKLVSEGRTLCKGGCQEWLDPEDLMDGLCWGCRPENQ